MPVGFAHRRNYSPSLEDSLNEWNAVGGSGSSFEGKGGSWPGNGSAAVSNQGSSLTSLTLPHLRHHHHSRNHGSNGSTPLLRYPGRSFNFRNSSGNSNTAFYNIASDTHHPRDNYAYAGGSTGESETFSEKMSSSSRLFPNSPDPSETTSLSQFPSLSQWASGTLNKNNLREIAHTNSNGALDKLDVGSRIKQTNTVMSASMTNFNNSSPYQLPNKTSPSSIEQFVKKLHYDSANSSFTQFANFNSSAHNISEGMGNLFTDENSISLTTSLFEDVNSSTLETNWTGSNNETNITASSASASQGSLYAFILPVMLFLCVLAVLVNLLIVISARWCRKPMSPTLYFSISLALADAYAALFLAIGLVINSLLPVVFSVRIPACFSLINEAFRQGGILVTVSHLLALAMNHWIGIVRPLHYAATMTRRTAWTVIIFSWICPITMIFIYFSSVMGEGFQSPGCVAYNFLLERTYRAFFASCFFAPLILMSFIYIHIFIIVRNHHTHRQRYQVKEKSSQQLKRNVKAVLTTMLVLGTYIIGYLPAVLYTLIVCKNCIYTRADVPSIVNLSFGVTINSLVILKTLVDPIIYAARMADIQLALKKMRYDILSKFCKSCAPPPPPNDRGSFYDTKSMRMSSFGSHSNSCRRLNNATNASVRLNGGQPNHNNHQQSHKQLTQHNGMMVAGQSNGYLPCASGIQSHSNNGNLSTRRSFVQSSQQPMPLINSKSAFEMAEIN